MISFILRFLLTGFIAYILGRVIEGVEVKTIVGGILLAIVLSLLNTFVKPVLVFFTLPITIFTLGIFYFFINIILLYLADYFLDDFSINSFLGAIFFSILLSIGTAIVNMFFKKKED